MRLVCHFFVFTTFCNLVPRAFSLSYGGEGLGTRLHILTSSVIYYWTEAWNLFVNPNVFWLWNTTYSRNVAHHAGYNHQDKNINCRNLFWFPSILPPSADMSCSSPKSGDINYKDKWRLPNYSFESEIWSCWPWCSFPPACVPEPTCFSLLSRHSLK